MVQKRTIRKRVQVPMAGQPATRVATIEDGATMGATIGQDLFFADGSIVTLALLAAALGVGDTSSSSSLNGLSATIWRLIREVPIYAVSPNNPTWEYTLDGDPVGNVGFAAVADGLGANTLPGDLVLAPDDGRVFIPVTAGNAALFIDGDVGGATTPLIMLDNTGAAADRRILRIRETDTLDRGFSLDAILSGDHEDNAMSWGSDFTGSIARAFKFWADGRVGFGNELFLFDPSESTSNTSVVISSAADVILTLAADTDNVTETHNPTLLFTQDAAQVVGRVGLTGTADSDSTGATFTGMINNGLAIHQVFATTGIGLGINGAVAFLINTTNENVFLTAARATAAAIALELEAAEPVLLFDETDAAANERQWRMRSVAGVFRLDAYTDAGGSPVNAIAIDRTGTTVSEIELNATALDFNGAADISSSLTIGAGLTENGTESVFQNNAGYIFRLRDLDAATNMKRFRMRVIDGFWIFSSEDDTGVQVEAAITILKLAADATIASITFNADTLDLNGNLDLDGTTHTLDGTTITLVGGSVTTTLSGALFSVSASSATLPALVGIGEAAGRSLSIAGTDAFIRFRETATPPADEGVWLMGADASGEFHFYTRTDADGAGAEIFAITRTGTALGLFRLNGGGEIELNATTLDFNGAADISGTLTVGGLILGAAGVADSSSVPFFRLLETDAAANNQKWFLYANGTTLNLSAATDAEVHTNFMQVTRSAGAVPTIAFAADTSVTATTPLLSALGSNSTVVVRASSAGAGSAGDVSFNANCSGFVTWSWGIDRSLSSDVLFVPAAAIDGASPVFRVTTAGAITASAGGAFGDSVGISGTTNRAVSVTDTAAAIAGFLSTSTGTSSVLVGALTNHSVSILINSSVFVTFGASGVHTFHTYGAGTLTTDASGNITAVSDSRLKENVRPYALGLAQIVALQPKLYRWKAESGLDARQDYVGFLAQDVEAVLPAAIGRMQRRKLPSQDGRQRAYEDLEDDPSDTDPMRTMNDRVIMATLVNAVRELSAKVDALEGRTA